MTRTKGGGKVKRTCKPTTAGIINIICGAWFLIGGATVLATLTSPLVRVIAKYYWHSMGYSGVPDISFVNSVASVVGVACIILGIVSVLGGVYAIRRRLWGIALTGSISTLICSILLGIPAIVFTTVAKGEFT